MSRSYRKAIYKDKGHRKGDYWKTYRRVSRSTLKHYIEGARELSFHGCSYDEYEEFIRFKNEFISKGLSDKEAYQEASYIVEDDLYFSRLAGNCYRDWWDEPNLKNPKELINDWDYSDYTFDYEYTLRYKYLVRYNWRTGQTETDFFEHEENVMCMRRK